MGRRSASKTVVAVYQAFLAQRTWLQPELARRTGVSVEALRKVLDDLHDEGMPLERDEDGGRVFWSVPKAWFPGAIALDRESAVSLIRELWRQPRTAGRKRLLERVMSGIPASEPVRAMGEFVLAPDATPAEETYFDVLEDAAVRATSLRVYYYSASSGLSWRHLSVHRVVPGPSARFVATCHRSAELRWFRIDGIMNASLDATTPYRAANQKEISRFMVESMAGFHESEPSQQHVFFVRQPEARWVVRNLRPPMKAELSHDGAVVIAETAGALQIARYVVSLGAAGRAETEPLRSLVAELARGALESVTDTARPKKIAGERASLSTRAVSSIRTRK